MYHLPIFIMQNREEKRDAVVTVDLVMNTVQVHHLDFNEDRNKPVLINDEYYQSGKDNERVHEIFAGLSDKGYIGPINCEEIDTPYSLKSKHNSTEVSLFFREQLIDVVAHLPFPAV